MSIKDLPTCSDAEVPGPDPERAFQLDDIKVEYHPNSGIPEQIHAFTNFKCGPTSLESAPPPNKQPWLPFKSRLEFEVAEIALEAAMNNEQTDRLIDLFNRCASRQEKFTFKNHKDIRNMWDAVSHRVTGVCTYVFLL